MQKTTMHLLTTIPFKPDRAALRKRLHIRDNGGGDELNLLVDQAVAVARPKALFCAAYITNRGEDWIEIEGMRFSSRVLRVNTDNTYRLFPFLATCGSELKQWAEGIEDVVQGFWAEAIMESALFAALSAFEARLKEYYDPGHTAMMNPGSLEDWPLSQQRHLFDLFDSQVGETGISLSEGLLMSPMKSVSGIRFPTDVHYENCQLCPREECPGRRAPYDADLYQARYQPHDH